MVIPMKCIPASLWFLPGVGLSFFELDEVLIQVLDNKDYFL
jgi:hypothetical protein